MIPSLAAVSQTAGGSVASEVRTITSGIGLGLRQAVSKVCLAGCIVCGVGV